MSTAMKQRSDGGGPKFDADFQEKLGELFRWRRDVRRFQPVRLPAGLLDTLLEHADEAPSVGLSQPWRFVIVDDPIRRAAVREIFEACNAAALMRQTNGRAASYAKLKLAGLAEAPVQLAVFVEPEPLQGHGLGRSTMPESVSFSAVLAIHTLWLAARAYGVGLGWVSILDEVAVREALDIPRPLRLVGYLCLGFPERSSTIPELEEEGWEERRFAKPIAR